MEEKAILERLALNDAQKKVLREFEDVYARMLRTGLHLTTGYGCGLYAYNANHVTCFNAPKNAAYDNGKEEVDITKMHLVAPFGMSNFTHLLNDTKCLVAFN